MAQSDKVGSQGRDPVFVCRYRQTDDQLGPAGQGDDVVGLDDPGSAVERFQPHQPLGGVAHPSAVGAETEPTSSVEHGDLAPPPPPYEAGSVAPAEPDTDRGCRGAVEPDPLIGTRGSTPRRNGLPLVIR